MQVLRCDRLPRQESALVQEQRRGQRNGVIDQDDDSNRYSGAGSRYADGPQKNLFQGILKSVGHHRDNG